MSFTAPLPPTRVTGEQPSDGLGVAGDVNRLTAAIQEIRAQWGSGGGGGSGITTVNVTGLPAGSDPTASYDAVTQTLDLGIPEGAPGVVDYDRTVRYRVWDSTTRTWSPLEPGAGPVVCLATNDASFDPDTEAPVGETEWDVILYRGTVTP